MSPRTKKQNDEIRSQRVKEILQAAVRVYVDKGYAASEIGEVAEKAGLARGLVYYYFKDKKTLFRELYQHMMDLSKHFTKMHFEQDKPVLDLFTGYARFMCQRVLEDPAVPRFYMRVSLDLHQLFNEEEVSPFEWVKGFLAPIAGAIEKGIAQEEITEGDPNLMAFQYWGSISHGMNYLDQLQRELVAQGVEKQEIEKRLKPVMEQAIVSSLPLFKAR